MIGSSCARARDVGLERVEVARVAHAAVVAELGDRRRRSGAGRVGPRRGTHMLDGDARVSLRARAAPARRATPNIAPSSDRTGALRSARARARARAPARAESALLGARDARRRRPSRRSRCTCRVRRRADARSPRRRPPRAAPARHPAPASRGARRMCPRRPRPRGRGRPRAARARRARDRVGCARGASPSLSGSMTSLSWISSVTCTASAHGPSCDVGDGGWCYRSLPLNSDDSTFIRGRGCGPNWIRPPAQPNPKNQLNPGACAST